MEQKGLINVAGVEVNAFINNQQEYAPAIWQKSLSPVGDGKQRGHQQQWLKQLSKDSGVHQEDWGAQKEEIVMFFWDDSG